MIGAIVGLVFDCSKVASLIWYLKSRFTPALILTIFIIFLSIAASVGTLQVSSEKAALSSPEFAQKKETLNFIDNQIRQKENLAKSQVKINQLTRSIKTQSEIDTLIVKREALNSELKVIQYSAAGSSGAMFRAFSGILDIDIYYIILLGNTFIALLLEIVVVAFLVLQFEKKENNILIGAGNNSDDKVLSKTFVRPNQKYDQNLDKVVIKNDNSLIQILKSDYRKTGKSDMAILHFWDSGIRNKSEIARQVKSILKMKRLSRQYCDQVVRSNRDQVAV